MLTKKELEAAIRMITDRITHVNSLYIQKIAAQLLKLGQLNPTSISRIVAMTEMGEDVREINKELSLATSMNVRDIYDIYQRALDDVKTDPRFREALTEKPLTGEQNQRLAQLAYNISTQTAQTMLNMSNTTAVLPPYKDAVDKAIVAVTSGLSSYTETARDIVRELGYSGLQVYYESGYHRRLDTAVRQNIIDGVNQINQNASLAMGEMLGFDAVEISAHAHSAPDHEPVQGRVFLLGEFEKMQAGFPFRDVDGRSYQGFARPISEWNCMHIAMSFSTQHSIRRYSEEQLTSWKLDNAQGCIFNGKHYTTYQAQQLMRQTETKVRREKDAAVAAMHANDLTERQARQKTINALSKRYYEIARAAHLSPKSARLSVEGFKAVKV